MLFRTFAVSITLGLERPPMSTERSDKVHENWWQAAEKFDYFILGVTGALCAYTHRCISPCG